MQTLSPEEIDQITDDIATYAGNGEYDKAIELMKLVPLPAYLAKAAKEVYGADFLLENGYNLSEAEATYGQNWLN